jgi:hypothetical protein
MTVLLCARKAKEERSRRHEPRVVREVGDERRRVSANLRAFVERCEICDVGAIHVSIQAGRPHPVPPGGIGSKSYHPRTAPLGACDRVGVGDGDARGDADGLGEADGAGDGEADRFAEGFGAGDDVGEGVALGVGEGDGDGAPGSCAAAAASALRAWLAENPACGGTPQRASVKDMMCWNAGAAVTAAMCTAGASRTTPVMNRGRSMGAMPMNVVTTSLE